MSRACLRNFCIILVALCAVPGSRAAQPMDAGQLKQFGEKYCFSCHGAEKQKGDFDFRPYAEKGFTPGLHRLLPALIAEVDVVPAGEQIFDVPDALSVTNQDQFSGHSSSY